MPIGPQIGPLCLVDEAVEDAENADNAAQRSVHVVNVDSRLVHVPAQRKADAHFVKM
jgi:hypothetical protein